ncbi:MAG: DUF2085 domain-containing protein [Anaerolineae bacterium]
MAGGLRAHLGRGLGIVLLAAVLVVAYLAVPPYSFDVKAGLIGFSICHQLPERSFFLGARQLPLCARDTGTYLGAMGALAVMLVSKRRKRNGLPVTPVLALLALGFAFFAIDGLNSYADALPIVPQVYTPSNYLRLLSGMGCGIAIVAIVLPLFNYSVWRDLEDGPILDGRGFLGILVVAALLYAAVVWGPGWLYYPLALANVVGVLVVLSIVNGLLAYLILGRERRAHSWLDTLPILATGLLMAAIELGGLGYLRYALERAVAI